MNADNSYDFKEIGEEMKNDNNKEGEKKISDFKVEEIGDYLKISKGKTSSTVKRDIIDYISIGNDCYFNPPKFVVEREGFLLMIQGKQFYQSFSFKTFKEVSEAKKEIDDRLK